MRICAFARSAVMVTVFAFVVIAGVAADTSECAASDEATVYIYYGYRHEGTAEDLASRLNYYYSYSATLQNESILVKCPRSTTVGQMRTAIASCLQGISASPIIENDELLGSNDIGLYPVGAYNNYGELLEEMATHGDDSVSDWGYFCLLWMKPFDQDFSITIDTPQCGSTAFPSVTSERVPLARNYATITQEEPTRWFEQKPEDTETKMYSVYFDVYYYKGALKGGTSYYACAQLNPPWGYYFPTPFNSKATANGQPADVMDATGGDEHRNLYVGAYVTAEHVWSDWKVTKAPTCSAQGTETRYCTSECGKQEEHNLAINPNAHKWSAWKTVKQTTALEVGSLQRVCQNNSAHVQKRSLPATGVKGSLLAQLKSKGKNKMVISWTKVTGAEGYDVYFTKCDTHEKKSKYKLVKSIKGNSTTALTQGKLKKGTPYKAYVKAFAYKNGKKTYVRTSPDVHAFASGVSGKYSNPKAVSVNKTSVTLKKGGTFKIKGKVSKLKKNKKLIPKGHGPTLRYCSSNSSVATVSSAGVIKAKAAGKCTIYILAIDGSRKNIAVVVK